MLHLLNAYNKTIVRRETFQDVLLELLFRSPDEDLLNLLPYTIDLYVFKDDPTTISASKDAIALVPKEYDTQSNLMSQIQEETLAFMRILLQLFKKKPDEFEHWFGIFKKYFMVSLYPKVSKEIGAAYQPEFGFTKCPSRLQEVVVDEIADCMLVSKQLQHLWSENSGNAKLMLEVYRQGLLVDLDPEIQKKLLNYYWKALFKECNDIPANQLKSHQKFYIEPLPLIIRGEGGEKSEMDLLLAIQAIFKRSVHDSEVWHKLDEEMRLLILTSCLKLATNLLKGDFAVGVSAVVETVLDVWVHAQVMNKSYWETLRTELAKIMDNKEVVEHIQVFTVLGFKD